MREASGPFGFLEDGYSTFAGHPLIRPSGTFSRKGEKAITTGFSVGTLLPFAGEGGAQRRMRGCPERRDGLAYSIPCTVCIASSVANTASATAVIRSTRDEVKRPAEDRAATVPIAIQPMAVATTKAPNRGR
jgi:hypothetical protein